MSKSIELAREVMRDAFADSPDFRHAYQANIAMLLHDRHGITDHTKRNAAADDVIALVFGENEKEDDVLSASEAVYGFASWLTTREEKAVFSAEDNAAPAAELVGEFCEVNDLPDPREDWTKNLTQPSNKEAVEEIRKRLD